MEEDSADKLDEDSTAPFKPFSCSVGVIFRCKVLEKQIRRKHLAESTENGGQIDLSTRHSCRTARLRDTHSVATFDMVHRFVVQIDNEGQTVDTFSCG